MNPNKKTAFHDGKAASKTLQRQTDYTRNSDPLEGWHDLAKYARLKRNRRIREGAKT